MAEYDLTDESSVGVLVRTRVKKYEEAHPGCSVFAADRRGMWDIRFTCGEGRAISGTAYISAPEATGWVLKIHWPGGALGDIEKLDFTNTAGLEGLILKAIDWEAGRERPRKKR
ncbi:MAG: hypothetical protein ACM3X8_07635 [Methanomicrobiales archaeon]